MLEVVLRVTTTVPLPLRGAWGFDYIPSTSSLATRSTRSATEASTAAGQPGARAGRQPPAGGPARPLRGARRRRRCLAPHCRAAGCTNLKPQAAGAGCRRHLSGRGPESGRRHLSGRGPEARGPGLRLLSRLRVRRHWQAAVSDHDHGHSAAGSPRPAWHWQAPPSQPPLPGWPRAGRAASHSDWPATTGPG